MAGAEKLQFICVMHAVDPAKAASREDWTDYDNETFRLHWDRLARARGDGTLLVAGRAQDADGAGPAIVIFEVASEEEARRFMESEPFVTRGFATATLHPFRVALSRKPV